MKNYSVKQYNKYNRENKIEVIDKTLLIKKRL